MFLWRTSIIQLPKLASRSILDLDSLSTIICIDLTKPIRITWPLTGWHSYHSWQQRGDQLWNQTSGEANTNTRRWALCPYNIDMFFIVSELSVDFVHIFEHHTERPNTFSSCHQGCITTLCTGAIWTGQNISLWFFGCVHVIKGNALRLYRQRRQFLEGCSNSEIQSLAI